MVGEQVSVEAVAKADLKPYSATSNNAPIPAPTKSLAEQEVKREYVKRK